MIRGSHSIPFTESVFAGIFDSSSTTADGLAALDVEEVVAADGARSRGRAPKPGSPSGILVLGVVVHVLGRDPVCREPRRLRLVEVGPRAAPALRVEADRLVVERPELGGEFVVFHGVWDLRPAGSR